MKPALLSAAAALLLATAAPAQDNPEWTRRVFSFTGTRLTIQVLVEAPGTLRLTRGQTGQIEVAALTPDGFAGVGIGGEEHDRLNITAVGTGSANFIVVVPHGISVRVRLPDRHLIETFGMLQDVATYAWEAGELPQTPGGGAARATPAPEGPRLGYTRAAPPRQVSIQNARGVRKLTVRWEGEQFEVASSRPLALAPGDPEHLEIRPGGPPMDLVLVLPRSATEFVLDIGGTTVLLVRGRQAFALCTPVIEQDLGEGRRSFTFTPADGRLRCRREAAAERTRRSS